MHGFGVLVSPKKLLDYNGDLRSGEIELPSNFVLDDKYIPDVRNQGQVNSCVGFSITNIMQILNQKETGFRERFSAGYVYGKCRDDYDDYEGMYIDKALSYLKKVGACFERFFPENKEVPEIMGLVRNRPDLDEKAKPYVIKGYEIYGYAIKVKKYNAIKKALYQFNVPILADTTFFGASHAICIIGWNEKTQMFKILNSWGKEWGDNGIGEIPYSSVNRGYLLVDEKNGNILMPFTDVPKDEWYYEAVKHVYNAGLMNGTSKTTFEPEKPITRAEMAQVLVNLCKKYTDTITD